MSRVILGRDDQGRVIDIAVEGSPAGAVAALTHDSPSHLPPYIVVHMWKRTA